jgi:hypothetical protein
MICVDAIVVSGKRARAHANPVWFVRVACWLIQIKYAAAARPALYRQSAGTLATFASTSSASL